MNQFLLYGANGYTAGLIIEQAASFGLTPVLAGRSEEKIRPLAEKHGLSYRLADLTDAAALDRALDGLPVVLHCAGPFSRTAAPMQEACLRTGTHYLDITGEIAVFETGAALDARARERNVMLMSGVGFDVVPTDCSARFLKDQLPDATHLQLAFANVGGSVSHGTALTAVENLGSGGFVREAGVLKPVSNAEKVIEITFAGDRKLYCMTIPWGDLATAYRTTGIPNIETFMAAPQAQILGAKALNWLGPLLKTPRVQNFIRNRIDRALTGPGAEARQKARTLVWGRVWNAAGDSVVTRLEGPDGYHLTARTALNITQKVLQGNVKAGFQTPAGLYGADLILEIEGVRRV